MLLKEPGIIKNFQAEPSKLTVMILYCCQNEDHQPSQLAVKAVCDLAPSCLVCHCFPLSNVVSPMDLGPLSPESLGMNAYKVQSMPGSPSLSIR